MAVPAIKVCGVNNAAFAVRAEELGADYLGLIFAEGSPRRVSVEAARAIVAGLAGRARTVGVFTTATPDEIVSVAAAVGFRIVQLHRRASADDVAALKARGFEVWTLAGGAEADALLFDSSHGDGETVLRKGPWKTILAGGLSADNLADALASGADVLDVSGSLESTRGVKSIPLLESFWTRLRALRPDHNRQRKAAVINDYSSFGRCSLAVTLPILSALKVQCCSVPTAFFTNHTGFPHFSWTDNTDQMDAYIRDWLAIGLRFDAIATGFLGSVRQIDFVKRFVAAFQTPETLIVVDPVMGDYGRLYPTYDPSLAEAMRDLLDVADVLTPNLTEACVLANRPYDPAITDAELTALGETLTARHADRVVISGLSRGSDLVNFIYQRGQAPEIFAMPKLGPDRSGTGDVFSSVIVGDLVRGVTFADAARHAASFVSRAVARTIEMGLPATDGLAIEEVLLDLQTPRA